MKLFQKCYIIKSLKLLPTIFDLLIHLKLQKFQQICKIMNFANDILPTQRSLWGNCNLGFDSFSTENHKILTIHKIFILLTINRFFIAISTSCYYKKYQSWKLYFKRYQTGMNRYLPNEVIGTTLYIILKIYLFQNCIFVVPGHNLWRKELTWFPMLVIHLQCMST